MEPHITGSEPVEIGAASFDILSTNVNNCLETDMCIPPTLVS